MTVLSSRSRLHTSTDVVPNSPLGGMTLQSRWQHSFSQFRRHIRRDRSKTTAEGEGVHTLRTADQRAQAPHSGATDPASNPPVLGCSHSRGGVGQAHLSIMSSVSQLVRRGWRSKRQNRKQAAHTATVSISATESMCVMTLPTTSYSSAEQALRFRAPACHSAVLAPYILLRKIGTDSQSIRETPKGWPQTSHLKHTNLLTLARMAAWSSAFQYLLPRTAGTHINHHWRIQVATSPDPFTLSSSPQRYTLA